MTNNLLKTLLISACLWQGLGFYDKAEANKSTSGHKQANQEVTSDATISCSGEPSGMCVPYPT